MTVTGPVVCTTPSRYVAMWPAHLEDLCVDYQLANISSIGNGMVNARGFSSFFKQMYRQSRIIIYIFFFSTRIYILLTVKLRGRWSYRNFRVAKPTVAGSSAVVRPQLNRGEY